MRRLTLLLVLVAVATVASATGHFKANMRQMSRNQINKENVMSKQNAVKAKNDVMTSKAARVISTQPQGTAYDYQITGRADYAFYEYSFLNVEDMNGSVRVVFADDGTVYLRNLLYQSGYNFGENWVQGTIEGNVLSIPLGQSIYRDDEYDYDIVLAFGEVVADEENDFAFVPDESVTEVKYLIAEDGSMTMQGGVLPTSTQLWEQEAYMGTGLAAVYSDDGSWGGFCNFSQVLSNPTEVVNVPTVITEQPEGEFSTYIRSGACVYNAYPGYGKPGVCNQTGKMFVVTNAETGKAYIQRASYWHNFASAWIEGDYDASTGLITIPVGQYVYYNANYNYGIQMMWGSTSTYQDVDPNTGEPVYYLNTEIDEDVTEIQFKIDGDHIYLLGSEGDMDAEYPYNMEATGVYWHFTDDLHMTALEFNTSGEYFNLVPAVPADPTDVVWFDGGDESGYSHIEFIPPMTDIDGNPLDPESLSFSFYTDDDQLFTFEASTYYYDLRWDMTEIPFSVFAEGTDFFGGYEVTTYGAQFYRTNAEGYDPFFTHRIGVQAIYTVDVPDSQSSVPQKSAVVNKSNIVYYELPPTAIDNVNIQLENNGPIYNVMGQKMNTSSLPAGIYIQDGHKFIVK